MYRGTIQVAGIPEAWLPIEVVVQAVTTTGEPGTLSVEQALAKVGDMVRRAMLDQLPDGDPTHGSTP